MRPFRFRGVTRIAGNVTTNPITLAELYAKAFLHQILAGLHPTSPSPINPSLWPTPPDTLGPLPASALAACATMLANGGDATNPTVHPAGDCVLASDLHGAAVRSCLAGAAWVPTDAQAIAAYAACTGYNPNAWGPDGNPTDQGTDPAAWIAWRKAGAKYPDGSVLIDAVPVDANRATLSQAVWLASGCNAWLNLPDAWQSEEDQGDVWDVAGPGDPDSGHGVFLAPAYDDKGITVVTWGETITMTWAAGAYYLVPANGGGVVAPLDQDAVARATGLVPAGVTLAAMEAYCAAIKAGWVPT